MLDRPTVNELSILSVLADRLDVFTEINDSDKRKRPLLRLAIQRLKKSQSCEEIICMLRGVWWPNSNPNIDPNRDLINLYKRGCTNWNFINEVLVATFRLKFNYDISDIDIEVLKTAQCMRKWLKTQRP